MSGPLTGLRVLDIATIVAAPSAATLLSDYGADVLKVELPGRGDGARSFPPMKEGKPLWWKVTNRNKRLISLDLRKPQGADVLKRLLPRFDVLVENFRPGTLDRWGLDRDTLWAINPRLVILRVTGYGQTGPYRNRPGFARLFESMGGLTYITGEADGSPIHAGYPIGDAIGGMFGAVGLLAALWRLAKDPDAPGEEIDLALTEATCKLLDFLPIAYDQLGRVWERSGNTSQYSSPSDVLKTKDDRWVSLSGSTDATFHNNCRMIGRPDLIDDPRFHNNSLRVEHAIELNGIFRDWCARHTLDEVLAAVDEHGGTMGPVYSSQQLFEDPQFAARDYLTRVPDHDFGEVRMQNVVPRFTRNPGRIHRTGGDIGEANDLVYREWLQMSEAEIAQLKDAKII
ncbi:MAG: CoA transferase [Burkholderiaceae bacterium]